MSHFIGGLLRTRSDCKKVNMAAGDSCQQLTRRRIFRPRVQAAARRAVSMAGQNLRVGHHQHGLNVEHFYIVLVQGSPNSSPQGPHVLSCLPSLLPAATHSGSLACFFRADPLHQLRFSREGWKTGRTSASDDRVWTPLLWCVPRRGLHLKSIFFFLIQHC